MLLDVALPDSLLHVEPREQHRQEEECDAKVTRELLEDGGRLVTEQVFGDATAERGAEALVLGPLHQHEQDDEQGDENLDDEEDVDEDGHEPVS